VRQLAVRLLSQQQAEVRQMNAWERAWSATHRNHQAAPKTRG
jgi:uncharacterized protein (DUF305 family)